MQRLTTLEHSPKVSLALSVFIHVVFINTSKWLMHITSNHYPFFNTFVLLTVVSLASYVMLCYSKFGQFYSSKSLDSEFNWPSKVNNQILTYAVVQAQICATLYLALSVANVQFIEAFASLIPLITILLRQIKGAPSISPIMYVAYGIIMAGVILCFISQETISFSSFLFTALYVVFSSVGLILLNALAHQVMLDSLVLLHATTRISCGIVLVYCILFEYNIVWKLSSVISLSYTVLVILNATLIFAWILLHFITFFQSSRISTQFIQIIKLSMTTLIAWIIFGYAMSWFSIITVCIICVGLFVYDRARLANASFTRANLPL
ncbi:hypothetical protein TrispH2_008506 [Trichoplax sp. H2]|nr:hypothetical protein TrispH2_008506 [Trichoplax sp. H2]|eukprot:RDD40465.1 hypothetical protein TrispH2_008506 [Trichoplax sp. H2]